MSAQAVSTVSAKEIYAIFHMSTMTHLYAAGSYLISSASMLHQAADDSNQLYHQTQTNALCMQNKLLTALACVYSHWQQTYVLHMISITADTFSKMPGRRNSSHLVGAYLLGYTTERSMFCLCFMCQVLYPSSVSNMHTFETERLGNS